MKRRPGHAYFQAARPHLFAHRGGASLAPENTLEAFTRGIELGCNYIETDIRLTADGELVVFHDAHLDRTTDATGAVASKTLAQLSEFNAGAKFPDTHSGEDWGARSPAIPSLDELMRWMADHPQIRVNIEIKDNDARARTRLLEAVTRAGMLQRCLIASSSSPNIRAFRAIAGPTLATSAGTAEIAAFYAAVKTGLWRWLPIPYDALQIPVHHKGLHVCTPDFVSAAHARGVQVHVWTIDDPAQMRSLFEMGVDGVMTDRPDLLTKVARSAFPKN